MTFRMLPVLLLASSSAGVLFANPATITFNNGLPITDTGWNACYSFPGYLCRTTAYFDGTSLYQANDSIAPLFDQAFTNGNPAAPNGYTLENDVGALGNDFGFNITVANAQQVFSDVANNITLGGLTIRVSVTGTLPTLDSGYQYVWLQGLYDNYGNSGIVPPFYEMDVDPNCVANSTACNPQYPYQYVDNHFYDQPRMYYQAPGSTQAFFDANAYFGEINTTTDDVKVYDGISYGWQNFVSPEPGAWALVVSGLALVLAGKRRRAA